MAMKSKRKWKKYWGMLLYSCNTVKESIYTLCIYNHIANLKKSVLFLYECEEQSALPEIETVHSDLKLGTKKY